LRYRTTSLLAAAFGPAIALAAQPIEEVVVRAGFYDAELMKSAGSISVFDEAAIEARGAVHLDDMLGTLANVSFSSGGGRARFVQMRGVGDLEQFVDPKHFPSVGVTIDGIEVGPTATGALLMDVAQVEVLRGPQGTRFGANALAGMVNIRTEDPTGTLSGYVDSGYGNYDTWHAGGVLNGPLAENLNGRIAIRQDRSDGYIDNTFLHTDDTNDRDEFTTRGKLHWSPAQGNDVLLTAAYSNIDNGYDAFSLENSRSTRTDRPGTDAQESATVGLASNWGIGDGIQLETQLSWISANERYGFDEDWVYAGFCDGVRCDPAFEFMSTDRLVRDRDVLAADVRLKSDPSRLSWVVGFFTQHRDEDLKRAHFGRFVSRYETERYAGYGQLIFELSPRWSLTGGFRYEYFTDTYLDSTGLATDASEDYWTGELTIEHFYTDKVLFYSTLSRGVKPGGVNTDTSSNLAFVAPFFQPFLSQRQRFSSETLFNKEIGVKASVFDDRLAVRLSAFHMDRSNAQLESFIYDPFVSFVFTGYLDSSSDAENYGAELELNFAATRRIALFANIGYLETNVDGLTVFDLGSFTFRPLRDRDQAKSPNWTYDLGANITLSDRLRGHIEVEGRSTSYFGYYHDGEIDGYTLVHASLAHDFGALTAEAWVRNVFDTNYAVHGLYFANDPRDVFSVNRSYYQRGEPRVFGVNLSYRF